VGKGGWSAYGWERVAGYMEGMTSVNHSFRTELSAVASGEPVPGWVARFEATDGRQVEVQVPRAVAGLGPIVQEAVIARTFAGRAP